MTHTLDESSSQAPALSTSGDATISMAEHIEFMLETVWRQAAAYGIAIETSDGHRIEHTPQIRLPSISPVKT